MMFKTVLAFVVSSVIVMAGCGGGGSDSSGETPISDAADLSDLTVSAGTLTPAFAANITDYTVSVDCL